MTNTPIHTNFLCGTAGIVSTDGLPNVAPTRIALESTTTLAYLILRVTLGALTDSDRTNSIKAYFAPSLIAYNDAVTGSYAQKFNARYVEIPCRPNNRQLTLERRTDLEMCNGLGYVFVWLEVPNMSNILTVNTNLIQLP